MPLLVVSTSPSPGGIPFDFQGNPAEPTPLCRGYRRALHLSSGRVRGEVAACTRAVLGPRTLRSGPPLRDGLTRQTATVHPPEPTRSGIRTLTAFPPPKDTASPRQGSPLLTPAPRLRSCHRKRGLWPPDRTSNPIGTSVSKLLGGSALTPARSPGLGEAPHAAVVKTLLPKATPRVPDARQCSVTRHFCLNQRPGLSASIWSAADRSPLRPPRPGLHPPAARTGTRGPLNDHPSGRRARLLPTSRAPPFPNSTPTVFTSGIFRNTDSANEGEHEHGDTAACGRARPRPCLRGSWGSSEVRARPARGHSLQPTPQGQTWE